MALVQLNFSSQPLGKQSALYAALPQGRRDLPVLYLLHGLSDDYTTWLRRTSIERYAERFGVMVVMADGGRGFYTDAKHVPGAWESHLLAVVDLVDATLPTAARRQCRAIGGLSMGGYGAIKLALKHPERFGSAHSHSGSLDIADRLREATNPDLPGIFGATLDPAEDCFALAARRGAKPRLRIDCGVDDFLIGHSRRFHAHLTAVGVAHEYAEFPGAHEWEYWDRHIVAALEFHVRGFTAAPPASAPAKPAAAKRSKASRR